MLIWLESGAAFPPVSEADADGLLAVGGDLSTERLVQAYSQGIFPWFSEEDPILWWSPSPRMVMFPEELKISRSLAKTLRNTAYQVKIDSAFRQVMQACSQPRAGQPGTWILPQMVEAYCLLHEQGYAHSFETWMDGQLVGGLYGVAIGQMFYGESMFAHRTDASKIAFVHMVRHVQQHGVSMIDCQVYTPHLASLGARLIDRASFMQVLTLKIQQEQEKNMWNGV